MTSLEDVQVKVQKIEPVQVNLHGLPCHIQRMNDGTLPFSRTMTLSKGQEEYFDLVGYSNFLVNSAGELHLRRIDGAVGIIENSPCEVLIRITAKGIVPFERWFRVWIDSHNLLNMEMKDHEEAISCWCPNSSSRANLQECRFSRIS